MVTACAAGPTAEPRPGAGTLPNYEIGDTFVYSNRRSERVVAINGNEITWEDHKGRRYAKDRNIMLPRLSRESKSRIETTRIWGTPEDIWPLQEGQSMRFRAQRIRLDKKTNATETRTREWQCKVTGTSTISVPAGTFDTWRTDCTRYKRKGMAETRTWYYAPEVGHFVRYERNRFNPRRTKTVNLVAKLSGEQATPEKVRAVFGALDSPQTRN